VVTQDFDSSLAFVLSAEGGFSNVPGDSGGATNFGVTQSTYSAWLARHGMHDAPVAGISHEYAEALYLEMFWQADGCGVAASPLNLVLFDASVNHGGGASTAMLISATAFPGATPEQEAFALLALRDNLYRRIVSKDPTQGKFLKGWLSRLAHLRTAAGL
jgi:lysozyme family protein